jgi:hypothetical protein
MEEDLALAIEIACRFDRIVHDHNLEPAHTPEEVASRLLAAHYVAPMDLRALLNLDEVDIVVRISDIVRQFDGRIDHPSGPPSWSKAV